MWIPYRMYSKQQKDNDRGRPAFLSIFSHADWSSPQLRDSTSNFIEVHLKSSSSGTWSLPGSPPSPSASSLRRRLAMIEIKQRHGGLTRYQIVCSLEVGTGYSLQPAVIAIYIQVLAVPRPRAVLYSVSSQLVSIPES